MPYRVDPKTGMIECDNPLEAINLASMIQPNQTKNQQSKPGRKRPKEPLTDEPDWKQFLQSLQPKGKKLIEFAVLRQEGLTIEWAKHIGLKDGRGFSAVCNNVRRQGFNFRIPQVVSKEGDNFYSVTSEFREFYKSQGSPNVSSR